jgi:hypothetical protein
MASECSPAIEETAGAGETEVPRPKEMVIGSSSEDISGDGSGDGTDAQGEESETVDPRESSQSYDFGPLTVTIGRIRKLPLWGILPKVPRVI